MLPSKIICCGERCRLVRSRCRSLGISFYSIGDGRGFSWKSCRGSMVDCLLSGLVDDRRLSSRILKSRSISWRNDQISTARSHLLNPTLIIRRPRFVVLGELYMTDDSILVQGYNDKWRKQRKILHQALVPRAILKYKPIQDAESKRLLWDLFKDPTRFETHLNRYCHYIVKVNRQICCLRGYVYRICS